MRDQERKRLDLWLKRGGKKKKEIELFKYVNNTANSAHEQYKDLPNTSNQLSISFEYIEHRYKDSFLYKKY